MSIETFKMFDFLKNTASQVLYFNRDKDDSFEFGLKILREKGELPLKKNELSFLLPSGSKWQSLIGWRSIFCIPLTKGNVKFYVLGVEEVLPHETRGAYPILHAYIFQEIKELYVALRDIRAILFDKSVPENLVCEYNGVLSVRSKKPVNYKKHELWIMKCAEKKYMMGEPILFRTLILNELHLEQIKSLSFFNLILGDSNKITIENNRYLLGSSKDIESRFSYKGKIMLSRMYKIPYK